MRNLLFSITRAKQSLAEAYGSGHVAIAVGDLQALIASAEAVLGAEIEPALTQFNSLRAEALKDG